MKNNSIKYKNTNNDFVPQIPENWELRKIKFASSLQSGFALKALNTPKKDILYLELVIYLMK